MGRCARRVKSIAKSFQRQLTPVGVKLIGDLVGIVAETDWTSDEKRERAVDMAKAQLKARGIEAKETAIRAAIEASVAALKEGQAALAELGQGDDADVAELDAATA